MNFAGEAAWAEGAAVELRGVVKDFPIGLRGMRLRALDHVDLRVARGEVFGLLGPNGSGKSTAIKIMLGLAEPTKGNCVVLGQPAGSVQARRAIGYLPEAPNFYEHLSGRELVRFYARMCGMGGAACEARVRDVLAEAGLNASAADRRVETYSKGMRQRVGLAQALVHDPELLILDEPTSGLDPLGTADVTELILRLKAAGKTVVVTSHLLSQMEEVCDRIAILAQGRVVLAGAVPELLAAHGERAGAEARRLRLDRIFVDRVRACMAESA